MRVYHFIDELFGIDDIQRRRIKIARIDKLNDPFDWFSVNWPNQRFRMAHHAMVKKMAENTGLLCFSRDWRNPVQWSHYADKHEGLCLGFDVPDTWVEPVVYQQRRIVPDILRAIFHQDQAEELVRASLITKFSHWRYEQEVRAFVRLDPVTEVNGNFFFDFSDQLTLREVIVGVRSNLNRERLHLALGNLVSEVRCRKARLAFNTFRIVEQRKASLWL